MNERIQNGTELYHHGILGQKWGVRRFQNADGTRTAAGKKRYSDREIAKNSKKAMKEFKKAQSELNNNNMARYATAHNLMADEINAKLEKNPVDLDSPEADELYKEMDRLITENYNMLVTAEMQANAHYKKARSFVAKLGEEAFNEEVLKVLRESDELIDKY